MTLSLAVREAHAQSDPPASTQALAAAPTAQAPAGQWMPTPDGRYAWVPAGYEPAPVLPYREGQPIPPGYHLEERPRRGAVITGYILTGIPYGIGLVAALSSEFANKSMFLALPWVGPWLTLGLRDSKCDLEGSDSAAGSASDTWGCAGSTLVATGLILDGIIQAAGGTLLLAGYLAPSQKLVRDDAAYHLTPMQIGSGYGFGAVGAF